MMQTSLEREVLNSIKELEATKQIARWKLDNGLERTLAKRADHSLFWKKAYVLYYKLFDGKYYHGGISLIHREIRKFRKDVSNRELRELTIDMVYSLHRFGAMFTEYFLFDFPNLNTAGREQYITSKMRYVYCNILNPKENTPIFDQKDKTYELFKDYYGRDAVVVSEKLDLNHFCHFVEKNARFVKKPVHNSSGRGVEVLSTADYESVNALFDYLLSTGPCLIEQIVTNCTEIQNIYPTALSTIRVPTIRTKESVEIFAGYIRFGQKGSVVDNVGSGGIIAMVDMASGIIETPAYDGQGNKYLTHPDTGERIVGFQIPMWESAIQLAKELSHVVPSSRYVGWDLALTETGWIMVEGNARGEFYGQQFPDRVGKKMLLEELILS